MNGIGDEGTLDCYLGYLDTFGLLITQLEKKISKSLHIKNFTEFYCFSKFEKEKYLKRFFK